MSELKEILEKELEIIGDMEVIVSVEAGNKMFSTNNLTTVTDNIKKDVWQFRISNWMF